MNSASPKVRLLADRRLHLLLLAAVVLRALWLLVLWRADPTVRVLISDPEYYDAWARTAAAGETFRPGLPHWLPPLYPWILGGLYGLGATALPVVLGLQALVGVAVTTLLVAISDRVTSRGGALAAGWLWTLYLPTAYFETRLLGLNAALPLCAGALWLGLVGVRRIEQQRACALQFLMCGLLAGVACLARPNLLLLPPLAGLVGLVGAFRGGTAEQRARLLPAALLLLAGLAAGIAPGLISNLQRSDQPVLVSANGGVNFWFGNNAEARGTFHAPGPEWGNIAEQRDVSVGLAARALNDPGLDERGASGWWVGQGLGWIRSEPVGALRLLGLKLADSLSSTEFGIQYTPTVSRQLAPALWLAPLPFGLLLALAALGAARVRSTAGPIASGVLAGWVAAGLLGSLLYFTYSRFRMPWLLALMPLCGAGLMLLVDVARRRARLSVVATLIALGLLAQSFVPFEGPYPLLLRSNSLVQAAQAHERLEQHGRRRAPLERALELVPGNARALHELARLELSGGRGREALTLLERAVALPVDYPPALIELANLIGTSRDPALRDPARALALLEAWKAGRPADDPLLAMAEAVLAKLRP